MLVTLATYSPWPLVNVKESTKSESGTRKTLSENRALWYFKIIYTHTKNAMSFLPKLRFKTLQYQSQTTKREAGASATWRVPGGRTQLPESYQGQFHLPWVISGNLRPPTLSLYSYRCLGVSFWWKRGWVSTARGNQQNALCICHGWVNTILVFSKS